MSQSGNGQSGDCETNSFTVSQSSHGQSGGAISLFILIIVWMDNCVDPDQLASDEAS